MSDNILSREEYYLANLGNDICKTYEEYRDYEQRKKLRDAIEVLLEFNKLPFYPTTSEREANFTQIINGFSGKELNQINDIIDTFNEKIKEWDFRWLRNGVYWR